MYSDSDTSEGEAAFPEDRKLPTGYTAAREYTEADLYPTKKDPLCNDPDWPLAAYWPVFVGGFRVESWEEKTWNEQISNYFAYNGLMTRMMVFPESDHERFQLYQKKVLLLDALVYFTSKEDAKRAVATCHHQFYYGYRLNVLPGRFPLFFDPVRTIRYHMVGFDRVVERNIVRVLFGAIDFAARYPPDDVIVEFTSTKGMLCALTSHRRWRPQEVTEQIQKQRFLEQDIIPDIEKAMKSNPAFMSMQPATKVLMQLFKGEEPTVSTLWIKKKLLKSPFLKQYKHFERRKLGGKKMSRGRWETQNIIEANKILQKHGVPLVPEEAYPRPRPKMTKAQKRQLWINREENARKRELKMAKRKYKRERALDTSDIQSYDRSFDTVKIKTEPGSSQDRAHGNFEMEFNYSAPNTFKIKSEPGISRDLMNYDRPEMRFNDGPSTSSQHMYNNNNHGQHAVNPYNRNPPGKRGKRGHKQQSQQPVDRSKLMWRNPNMFCNYCGKPGHFRDNCFHLQK